MTYGDGVASVNIDALLRSHRASGCAATLTAVQPPGRFGVLQVENGKVAAFREKPSGDSLNKWRFLCALAKCPRAH